MAISWFANISLRFDFRIGHLAVPFFRCKNFQTPITRPKFIWNLQYTLGRLSYIGLSTLRPIIDYLVQYLAFYGQLKNGHLAVPSPVLCEWPLLRIIKTSEFKYTPGSEVAKISIFILHFYILSRKKLYQAWLWYSPDIILVQPLGLLNILAIW